MPPRFRLHIDESGSPRWPAPWGTNPDKHYVVVGLVMDGAQSAEATEGVPAILEKYFPDPATRPGELHYGDIVNARKLWSKLSGAERKSVSDDVFGLLLEITPTIMGTVVVKEHLKTRYGDSAISPALYGLRATFGRFDRYLADKGTRGDLVLDSAGLENDLNVKELVKALRDGGTRLGARRRPGWLDSHLVQIDEVRCVDSRSDHGIQLADFVAYATRAKFERGQSDRFEQIDRLWRRYGTRKEPVVIPSWG